MAMAKKNRPPLVDRVGKAAAAALAEQNYVSPIDVLMGIGWLDFSSMKRWRQGQIDCLEGAVQINSSRLMEAMDLLRAWAAGKGLSASATEYFASTPRQETLRFSASGDPEIELLYRTHWVSAALSEKQQQRLAEKTSRPPDLVVIQPLNKEWKCHRCGDTGGLLIMENPGPACLRCVGLDDLEFLPAGDALVTRRVRARSTRHAVVVRFSKSRGRYERQGLLVEPGALAAVEHELEGQKRG
jgi:hypothetical protein